MKAFNEEDEKVTEIEKITKIEGWENQAISPLEPTYSYEDINHEEIFISYLKNAKVLVVQGDKAVEGKTLAEAWAKL